jgi:hypothetical protein
MSNRSCTCGFVPPRPSATTTTPSHCILLPPPSPRRLPYHPALPPFPLSPFCPSLPFPSPSSLPSPSLLPSLSRLCSRQFCVTPSAFRSFNVLLKPPPSTKHGTSYLVHRPLRCCFFPKFFQGSKYLYMLAQTSFPASCL